jgi:cysteine desulfurase
MSKLIYLDNAATTKPLQEVVNTVKEVQENNYGNASSLHSLGINAENLLNNARKLIANTINANENQIIFTSGGTESNNLAIKGSILGKKGRIITTKIEHSSVLNVFKTLEKDYEVVYLNVNSEGFIDLEQLKNEINENTLLVSIIHANNEIGTIQDIKEISEIIKQKNPKTLFHIDACQSFTETDLTIEGIDLMSINSHKIHGPKGIAALFVRDKNLLNQMCKGGHQEFDKRPGTENIPAIVGFAKAVEIGMNEKKKNITHMKNLQKYFIDRILNEIPNTKLNGPKKLNKRLCNNINITFNFIEGEALLMMLNERGICVSTGSACSSKTLEASHVILALGKKHEDAHGTIRFSLSKFTTKEELDYTIKKLKEAVTILRKISHLS